MAFMDGKLDFVFASNAEVLAELGQRLRTHRLRQGLRQVDVASAAGVGLATLKALESQGSSTLLTLVRVLRALGLETELQSLFLFREPTSIQELEAREAAARQRAPSPRARLSK